MFFANRSVTAMLRTAHIFLVPGLVGGARGGGRRARVGATAPVGEGCARVPGDARGLGKLSKKPRTRGETRLVAFQTRPATVVSQPS